MLPIEEDFFLAINSDNPTILNRFLERGLTANTKNEKGLTGLEYAIEKYKYNAFTLFINDPKTSLETKTKALDYIEVMRLEHPIVQDVKRWEKKSIGYKIFDTLFGREGISTYGNAADFLSYLMRVQLELRDSLNITPPRPVAQRKKGFFSRPNVKERH